MLETEVGNWASHSVDQLRQILVDEFGYSLEDIQALKGKNKVKEVLEGERAKKLHKFLEEANKTGESVYVDYPPNLVAIPDRKTPRDVDWSDFVLSQLDKTELWKDKYPTAHGLRRLAMVLLGDIVESITDVKQCPSTENSASATVVHTVTIRKDDGELIKFSGAADASPANTVEPYDKHLVSNAETKAESRAYRRALQLKVATAEEMNMSKFTEEVDIKTQPGKITADQLMVLNMLAKKCDINPLIFVELEVGTLEKAAISVEVGNKLCEKLTEYRADQTKIPEEIKGYKENW